MWAKVRIQLHSLACGYPVLPVVLRMVSLNGLGILVKNHLTIYAPDGTS